MRINRSLYPLLFQTVIWVAASNLYMVCRIVGLEEYERIQVIEPIRYSVAFIQTSIGGFIIGLLLGLLDLFFLNKSLRDRSFGFLVFIKGIIYIGTIIFVLAIIHLISDLFLDKYATAQALSRLGIFFSSEFLLSILIYCLFISFLVSFIKQVDQKFGPGVMLPLFLGRYHKPKQEERIFMFLDLRSSTTYAEKIGHVKYSEMIQDCFLDLATQVENFKARIYQYVGDEAVLTWKMRDGLRNNNFIKLFFAFNEKLKSRAPHYSEKYGFIPEFKAGVNSGLVMVAEVGEVKKEIAFHGDTLNTGARIQSKCNEYEKQLLISEQLRNQVSIPFEFAFSQIGSVDLKGKITRVTIYSVEQK